ncbi:MAG TPA: hypothetical protein VIL01_15275 [Thermomicrobiales bacterium]
MSDERNTPDPDVSGPDLQALYPSLSQAEIDDLPILEPGATLEAGGVYLDLSAPERGPFKALEGQQAGSGNRYVAQRDVDPEIWRRLVEEYRRLEPTETPEATGASIGSPYEQQP